MMENSLNLISHHQIENKMIMDNMQQNVIKTQEIKVSTIEEIHRNANNKLVLQQKINQVLSLVNEGNIMYQQIMEKVLP